MSEKRIVIPQGMTAAAHNATGLENNGNKYYYISRGLEAALFWMSENPIVPSEDQVKGMIKGTDLHWGWDSEWPSHTRDWLIEWQRRMFLAPEPEVPKELEDLLCAKSDTFNKHFDDRIIEAFRRGQKAGSR